MRRVLVQCKARNYFYSSLRSSCHAYVVTLNCDKYRKDIQDSNFRKYLPEFLLMKSYCTKELNCWHCQEKIERDLFFCNSCGSLQNADKNINYFELFSLEKRFDMDNKKLTKNFRHLQSIVHPDKFSNKSEKEQQNSLEWSSLINKAYKTLSTPFHRGEYILKLKGIVLPQDTSTLDKEFLMEMMDRNEGMLDANKDDLLNLELEIKKELDEFSVELGKLFDKNDYENAKQLLVKMKYILSLEKRIKEKALTLKIDK